MIGVSRDHYIASLLGGAFGEMLHSRNKRTSSINYFRRPLFELEQVPPAAKIKVIGLGGGGGNAVSRMMSADFTGVDFIVANTDLQALRNSPAPVKIQLGAKLTQGLGAGSNPDVGRGSALATPIRFDNRVWGMLEAYSAVGAPPFTASHVRFAEALCAQVATAIGRAELFSRL